MDWNYLARRRNLTLKKFFDGLGIKNEVDAIKKFKEKSISGYSLQEVKDLFVVDKIDTVSKNVSLEETNKESDEEDTKEFIDLTNDLKNASSKKKNKRGNYAKRDFEE
jgi:hypothetical protein